MIFESQDGIKFYFNETIYSCGPMIEVFSDGFIEVDSQEALKFDNIQSTVLYNIILYCMKSKDNIDTSDFVEKMTPSMLISTLKAANYMAIDGLVSLCVKQIANMITLNNRFDLIEMFDIKDVPTQNEIDKITDMYNF